MKKHNQVKQISLKKEDKVEIQNVVQGWKKKIAPVEALESKLIFLALRNGKIVQIQ